MNIGKTLFGAALLLFAVSPAMAAEKVYVYNWTEYIPQARHDYYMQGRAIARAQVPDDVNAAALFLLTRGAGFVTGQLLPVNGGFVMN